MRTSTTVQTPSAFVFFNTAAMKSYLKVPSSFTNDDDLIDDLVLAAKAWAERLSNRMQGAVTIDQFWTCVEFGGQDIVLPLKFGPVTEVTRVWGWNEDTQTYNLWYSSDAVVDFLDIEVFAAQDTLPATVTLKNVPTTYNKIKIRYETGDAAGADIPTPIVQAMRMVVFDWYHKRGAEESTKTQNAAEQMVVRQMVGRAGR